MPALSLSTPAARIELRDLATSSYWDAYEDERAESLDSRDDRTLADIIRCAVGSAASAITDLGFLVSVDVRDGASAPATITVTACDGSTLTLDWEPMVDGFDYPTSGDDGCDLDEEQAQHEDEPETASCDGCGEDDAEDAGEGFAFCAACRAKDANAPRA